MHPYQTQALPGLSQGLSLTSLGGWWRLLQRREVGRQPARQPIHSPPQTYADNDAYWLVTLSQARREETTPLLFTNPMSS